MTGNLIGRLGHLIRQLRNNKLDDREQQYLAAVLDHYHQTITEWRTNA